MIETLEQFKRAEEAVAKKKPFFLNCTPHIYPKGSRYTFGSYPTILWFFSSFH